MNISLHVCVCTMCMQAATETGRGHRIPCNWNYRWVINCRAGTGNQSPLPARAASAPNHRLAFLWSRWYCTSCVFQWHVPKESNASLESHSTADGVTISFTANSGLYLNILSLLPTYSRCFSQEPTCRSCQDLIRERAVQIRIFPARHLPSSSHTRALAPEAALVFGKRWLHALALNSSGWGSRLRGVESWLWNALPHRGAKAFTWQIQNTMTFKLPDVYYSWLRAESKAL